MDGGVKLPWGFNLPYRGGVQFSIRGFNIPWMKIYPGVNLPWGSKYHMTATLMMYIPFGCASGNIDPKPGMSHYIPCLIAE